MITIERARKIDPSLEDLTDSQLERVLEILDNLAEITLDLYSEELLKKGKHPVHPQNRKRGKKIPPKP